MIKQFSIYFFSLVLLATTAFSQAVPDKAMNSFVNNLLTKMTLKEKIGQLNLVTPGGGIETGSVVSKNVEQKIANGAVGGLFGVIGVEKIKQAQTLAITKSRLKIPLLFGSDIIHGYKTSYPIPLAMASSWDMQMIEQSARLAAIEASADGLCWAFSPMVDVSKDPRWGRVAEGAGEDAYLGGQIAAAMVRGYQGKSLADNTSLMACVKHFALYGAAEGGRDYNTVDMSRLKMYNDYLIPYKAAIDAGCGSVMSSFNVIDNIPATGNKWLLTDLLRKQWGFTGFVVSDYTSVNEMIDHGMGNLQTVSALALKAGLDMDMVGEGFLSTLEKSLQEKKISIQDIDIACKRILEAKYKLGLFENPYKYCDTAKAKVEVLNAKQIEAARYFAQRSVVLLKNSNQILPLQINKKVALIGPLANNKNNMLGTWAVSGNKDLAIPVADGFKNAAIQFEYAKGANISSDTAFAKKVNVFGTRIDIDKTSKEDLLKEAVAVANKNDIVVAIIGEASEMSGESSSRSSIAIPAEQKQLLQALHQTGKPLIVVILSGRPLLLQDELQLADAVLFSGHGGQEFGNAIVDVLLGKYNPSGKITMSFPRNEGQIPVYYNHLNTGRPNGGDAFRKFRSNYLDVENSPLLPFGYGISYTKFSYSSFAVSKKTMTNNETITASVTVTNTGNFDGEEVVQLYVQDEVATIARPVKELKAFEKIFLKKGESKTVNFSINKSHLQFYNSNLQLTTEPGKFNVFVGGNSTDVLKASFELVDRL